MLSGAVLADRADAYLESCLARYNIPALSVAVTLRGKEVKAAGFGIANLEWGTRAAAGTVYEIGSISKHFTAVAILLLVEEGRLRLDDPLSRYVDAGPAVWNRVTLRNVMQHTSGLPDWESAGVLSYRRDYTDAEYIAMLRPLPLDFEPGTRWAYSNSGYPLLGMVIEKVSGMPYERFMRSRVFEKAGMANTRFKVAGEIVKHRAAGYIDVDGKLRSGEPLRPRVIAPNGGVLSTAEDLARWSPSRVLNSGSAALMSAAGEWPNGLGWFVRNFRGHRQYFHNGSTVGGYSAVMYELPDDALTVAVLCNIDRGPAVNAIAMRLADFYVPGLSIQGLGERQDPDRPRTARLIAMLREVGATGRSPQLRESWKISPATKAKIAAQMSGFEVAAFLEAEGRTLRYRIDSRGRSFWYTFDLDPAGLVERFFFEE